MTVELRLRLIRLSRSAMRKRMHSRRRANETFSSVLVVRAPEVMDVTVDAYRVHTMHFLWRVEQLLTEGASVRLCFKDTNKLHPCGTLVFVSHVEVWQARYPGRLRLRGLPDDPIVAQLFKRIGMLERLGLQADIDTSHEMVRDWRYSSGHTMNPAAYKDLALSARSQVDDPNMALFPDCLNEAVTNTVDHAYEVQTGKLPPREMQKWWMFSQVREGRLSVVIYDQGIGIPRSLLTKPEYKDRIRKFHQKDGRLIEAAVNSERTSTVLPYRGKGLPEMLQFTKQLRAGRLSILSARGGFFYDAVAQKHSRKRYDIALPGTLVVWGIPLSPVHSD